MIAQEKFIGVLVGGCIGDVLGSQTEGMTRSQIVMKFGDMVTSFFSMKYTDDTAMTLTLARYLKTNPEIDVVKLHEEYAMDLERGYSSTTRDILRIFKDGRGAFLPIGQSRHNGSVMRIAPLSLLNTTDEKLSNLIKYALYYTHGGSSESLYSALVHVKFISYMMKGMSRTVALEKVLVYARACPELYCKLNLVKYLLGIPKINITKEIMGDENAFQIKAVDALAIAIYIFCENVDPLTAISKAASLGGDTDTIAKLVGDLCGAKYGTVWITDEMKNVEGYEELESLGKYFHSRYEI